MVVSPPTADALFSRFEIEFDAGPEPVFHGGEIITGSLKIQLKNECIINSIRLQFRGHAIWLGGKKAADKGQEGKTEKVYFDKDFVLLERPPGHPEPGHFQWNANFTYSLPFECPLPKGCETSYEGPHGFIRYYARAILATDEPSNKAQYLVKKAFTIVSPPELHQLVPPQSEPISAKKTVRFGGCCCRSKMSAEIHLPKSAYAPGENIVGTFTVDSRTAKNAIEQIEVRLVDRLHRILDIDAERAAATPTPTPLIENPAAATKNATETTANNEAIPAENNNNAAANAVVSNGNAKKKKQKKAKETTATANANKLSNKKGAASSVDQQPCRVVLGRKLAKADLLAGGADTEQQQNKGAQTVTRTDVLFMQVPAVAPTTQVDSVHPLHTSMFFDEYATSAANTNGNGTMELLEENSIVNRLLESPSTATLRARREPFLRVDYALQISIGTHVLLELPIQIHPIPVYAKGIGFGPFGGGEQPIAEPDDAQMLALGAPFMFRPLYPMYVEPPKLVVTEPTVTKDEAAVLIANTTTGDFVQPGGKQPTDDDAVVNGVKNITTVTTTTTKTVVVRHAGDDDVAAAEVSSVAQQSEPVVLAKAGGELGQQPFVTVEQQQAVEPAVTVQQQQPVAVENAAAASHPDGPVAETAVMINNNNDSTEQLANGLNTTTTTEWHEQNGEGGGETKTVTVQQQEQYEKQNEDGTTTTTVHTKTVEEITTTTIEQEQGEEEMGQDEQQPQPSPLNVDAQQ